MFYIGTIMIDIGANLSNSKFKDENIYDLLDKSYSSGITEIILTSTDEKSYYENIKIIEQNKTKINLYTTLGLHPHYANLFDSLEKFFNGNLKNNKVIAIGEFGLDYYRMLSDKKIQIKAMEYFLSKSLEINKPLFLHERDAFKDFYSLIKNNNKDKVVHCFSGSKKVLEKYLDLGCYIGVTGWITDCKRNHDILDCLKYIPLDKLMIETDAPYLTPKNMSIKSKINKPEFLFYVLKFLSEFLRKDIKDLEYILDKNTRQFFSI
jgi:TatD DNase family protein